MWLQLASHLGLSLQRCKQETTSREFLLWAKYLDQNVNAFHREDYFHAQTALLVAQTHSKTPDKHKLEHFLFKFTEKKPVERDNSEEAIKKRTAISKMVWGALVGLKIVKE